MGNWMSILLFSPVYIPLSIALAIFLNADKHNHAKRTLSLVLFNIAFLFYGLYFFLSGNYEFYAVILIFNVISMLMVYPGIYIYIRQLIEPGFPPKKIFPHLIPAMVVLLQGIVYYFVMDGEERILFVTKYRYSPDWGNPVLVFFFGCRVLNIVVLFIQIFYYGIKNAIILKSYRSTILEIFSNTEGIHLNGIRILNLVLFVSSLAGIAFYSINPIKVFGHYIVLLIPLAILSITIWFLGIVGLRQQMLPNEVVKKDIEDVQTEPTGIEKIFNRLLQYFEEQKAYLNPDLKIDELALILGTNRTHLSNAINACSGKNFNRFVNDFRIDYAKVYVEEHPNGNTREDVALNAGFGTIRTFERNFKENTGVSFNEYLIHKSGK